MQKRTETHSVCPNCGADAARKQPICGQCGHLTIEKVVRISTASDVSKAS